MESTSTTPTPRRIGIAEVERRLGVERTTIWRWYRAGKFPAPHYLGERRAWFLGEIEAWEAHRMAALADPAQRRAARRLNGASPSTTEGAP
jgi:predicted DNA-binding transcriptional regulator AlpA